MLEHLDLTQVLLSSYSLAPNLPLNANRFVTFKNLVLYVRQTLRRTCQ